MSAELLDDALEPEEISDVEMRTEISKVLAEITDELDQLGIGLPEAGWDDLLVEEEEEEEELEFEKELDVPELERLLPKRRDRVPVAVAETADGDDVVPLPPAASTKGRSKAGRDLAKLAPLPEQEVSLSFGHLDTPGEKLLLKKKVDLLEQAKM